MRRTKPAKKKSLIPSDAVLLRRCHHGQYVRLLVLENEGQRDVRMKPSDEVLVVGRFGQSTVTLHSVAAWGRAKKENAMCPIHREVDKDWPCLEVSM